MLNYLNTNKLNNSFEIPPYDFVDEKIRVNEIDYYHSNSIARASKTMTECKNIKFNLIKTGTVG